MTNSWWIQNLRRSPHSAKCAEGFHNSLPDFTIRNAYTGPVKLRSPIDRGSWTAPECEKNWNKRAINPVSRSTSETVFVCVKIYKHTQTLPRHFPKTSQSRQQHVRFYTSNTRAALHFYTIRAVFISNSTHRENQHNIENSDSSFSAVSKKL